MRPGDFSNATVMIDLSKILETNDRARYCNLILFSLAIIMNSVGWLTFAPITRLMSRFYPTDADFWNNFFVIYLLLSIPFNFLAIWVIEKKGLRTSLIIGVTL